MYVRMLITSCMIKTKEKLTIQGSADNNLVAADCTSQSQNTSYTRFIENALKASVAPRKSDPHTLVS